MSGDIKGERDCSECGGAGDGVGGSKEEVRSDQTVKDRRRLLCRQGRFRQG